MPTPYPAANMGHGWETKRLRGPGHDGSVVRLQIEGAIRRAEIATTHFKGNTESRFSRAATMKDDRGGVSADSRRSEHNGTQCSPERRWDRMLSTLSTAC